MEKKILIVDDDANVRRLLEFIIGNEGFQTFAFDGSQSALAAMAELTPDRLWPILEGILGTWKSNSLSA